MEKLLEYEEGYAECMERVQALPELKSLRDRSLSLITCCEIQDTYLTKTANRTIVVWVSALWKERKRNWKKEEEEEQLSKSDRVRPEELKSLICMFMYVA